MRKNDSGFNKDGTHNMRKWRLYCDHSGCDKYTIVKWGGGYGGVVDNDGNHCDIRNQCWHCDEHDKKQKQKAYATKAYEDFIKSLKLKTLIDAKKCKLMFIMGFKAGVKFKERK